ncbi:hypothetical protein ONE63_007188 [Megalurothrips usitatus]|uniref:FYVE-type domain-containing protein n=1 Tax=Megalurothrips usitatus TaxID=439358 RepID=A0AAV7XR96_9NEOP|nr:hypothetical protein ONE63_007188 [Megalurothrips usitatus]
MSKTCINHSVCVSQHIYQSEAVGSIQCQLSQCSSDKALDCFKTLCQSSIEEIQNASSQEIRKEASSILLCLLCAMPDAGQIHDVQNSLFDLCKNKYLDKKLLYSALIARSDIGTLTSFLDYERPFLRNEGTVCQSPIVFNNDIIMELFLITVRKQKHWLLFMLDELSLYLKQDNLERVQNVLCHPTLHFIWPLLFLQMLHSNSDISSLKWSAENTIESPESDLAIKRFAGVVLRNLEVVLWMKENNVACQTSSEIYSQTIGGLNFLNQCCDITNLDWSITHEFLAEHSLDGHISKRDIVLFDAFSACSLAFDYILTCLHSKHAKPAKHENVPTVLLEKLRMVLCQLQPISVRLKIMENIFSLLFLQYEDFHEDICSDSEEGEIDINQSFQCNGVKICKTSDVLSSSMTSVTAISTVDRDQSGQTKRKTSSENHTTEPAGESKNWHKYHMKHGFVCDRFMTRDLLKLLDFCLLNTNIYDDSFTHPEDCAQMRHIISDVDRNQVEKRLTSLRSKVSTALWKLGILLGQDFIHQTDLLNVPTDKINVPPWFFENCFDDDSASDDESPRMISSNIGLRRADTEKSSESGSQSNLASQGQGLNTKWNRKGRRRSSVRYCARGTKDTIIKRMLSSKHNLVIQCLARGNLEAAKSVIQTLKLESSEVSSEVNFIESYQTLKLKIAASAIQSNRQLHHGPNPKSQNTTLLAIQRAASAGVQTSSLNKEVEKLLSSQHLPRVVDVDFIPKDFLHLFGGSMKEQPVVAAAVDIALILSSNIRQAASFFYSISQELQNIQLTAPIRSRSMGFLPLIQNILQVSISESVSPSELLNRWDVLNFTSRHLKDALQFWDSLVKLSKEPLTSDYYAVLYPKFLQLATSWHTIGGNESKQECYYLQDFKSHLRLLKSCRDRSTVPVGDLPLMEEHFLLLPKSPYKMLANMVLEEGMLPQDLESLASQLGCNLPHILSVEFCSSLASLPPATLNLNLPCTNPQKGFHVLNVSDTFGPVRHPVKVVEVLLLSLLSELSCEVDMKRKLYQCSQNGHLIPSEVNRKRVNPIFASTWELRDLDLKLLQPGAETLVFYCNLANLMWIHAMVYFSGVTNFDDTFLKSMVAGNSTQQLAAMNSLAYQVGTAGILTLWEVRRLALGVHLMKPLGTKALQKYAMTTDSFDPLALFVIPTGTTYSPKLRVLYSDNLEEQLQQSVKEYVQHWSDVQSDCVIVPSLVCQYIQSTGQSMKIFLQNHVSGLDVEQENLDVSLYPDDPTPLIVMEYGRKFVSEIAQNDAVSMSWKSNDNLCKSILDYIKKHCPLVSLLLEELESDGEDAQEATENTATPSIFSPSYPCLDRLCKRLDTVVVREIFDSNMLLCALHSVVPGQLLWESINNFATEEKWSCVIDLLSALPPLQLQSDPMLTVFLDLALFERAVEGRDLESPWLYCEQMSSLCLQARCIITESIHWPGKVCLDYLKKILQIPELKSYPVLFSQAVHLMHSIEVYQNIIDHCKGAPWLLWQEVQCASQTEPGFVLKLILCNRNAELCVSWIELNNVTLCRQYLIDSEVMLLLLNDEHDRLLSVERFLHSMPIKRAANLLFEVLDALCRLPALQFCVSFLNLHCVDQLSEDDKSTLQMIALGVEMLKVVPASVQCECTELVCSPHLMIEQLVMNVQLEAAEQMLKSVRPKLEKLSQKSPLSISAIDTMLRQYAKKALEFRISQGSTASQTIENSVFSASLSSLSVGKDSQMPITVPSKAEWVPNELAAMCMSCQVSTFTMFNRRHHCRRCGRVVCAQCSPHKALVFGYGTLKVRVCSSCYLKIREEAVAPNLGQLTTATSEHNTSLPPDNLWRLSCSAPGNETVRDEFAYEHSPSVSLCLSILKLHSKSADCPIFLVDTCDTILDYLQPQGGMPNPEVDYGFVIEMCRSLALAAKVKCAQWGYISDVCDERLSRIDLFGLLESHGCTALIPSETKTHGLRRLQMQLIEAELWELALEVSTKSGLEKIGVWTSWGKGCLRAGRWKEAREKFAHCFPNSSRINKSAPDSPLLLDILQILESAPHVVEQDVLRKSEALNTSGNRGARASALMVLNTLASLKNVSQGKFIQNQGTLGSLQPHVYSECCYYLRNYSSHATYLQFLVRHNDFKAIVEHTLSYSIDPQIFFESSYMPCLRRGQITLLHSAMAAVDASLAMWMTYLHGICAALERRKLLHTLYEVQQWSKDHVRAAMTCIRFYHLNAKVYSHLAGNVNHLMRAQSHLEGALAIATLSRKTAQSATDGNSSPDKKTEGPESMWLQLTPKEIDHHMSTVERQKEATKFLSAYEAAGHTLYEAAQWFPHAFAEPLAHGLPTLFGSTAERKLIAGLCLFCGKNIEEGYGLVYRIIEGFNLSAYEIYEAVAVALFRSSRTSEISRLLICIHSSGITESTVLCDNVLIACFQEMSHQPSANDIDTLARSISDQTKKIKAFILCGQLKSAYLLAVKHDRLEDIERILSEADKLGQEAIKKICLKRLGRM